MINDTIKNDTIKISGIAMQNLGGALPATSRHTRHLPWLLPSGPDRVNKLVLRENQQDPIDCLIAKTICIIF